MTEPVAVITGGTRGLGLAFSERLIGRGYRVVALYRSAQSAARAAEDRFGGRLRALRADVAQPDQARAAAARIERDHGTPAVLVNNAGVNIDRPFLEMSDDDWRTVIDTNLSGVFYLTRALATGMVRAGGGVIVNVGATTGMRPRRDGANYCASKAGLLQLTKCLALELAPHIRVNTLIPGMTETEELVERFRLREPDRLAAVLAEIPQHRLASVDDVADALMFLVGADSSYLTGQKLIVDGGQYMW
jgi:acetoacetyl-CoA reductase/3-oxoacyl-[acyl-carrier protein] reductase